MSTHPFGVEASPGKLRVSGEIDLAVAPALLDAILSAGLTGDQPTLWVNLSAVTFMDSTGISALVQAAKRLREVDVDLRIEAAHESIAPVLDITGVGEHLGLSA